MSSPGTFCAPRTLTHSYCGAKLSDVEHYAAADGFPCSAHSCLECMAVVSGLVVPPAAPIPMRIRCEVCGVLHIDEGEFATKPHHTHACQGCGAVWRPAIVCTIGVEFLPGFKNVKAKR